MPYISQLCSWWYTYLTVLTPFISHPGHHQRFPRHLQSYLVFLDLSGSQYLFPARGRVGVSVRIRLQFLIAVGIPFS